MTDQLPTIVRTPYCRKIRYGITGAPILTADEMDGTFAPGVGVAPTLIELVYSPARDGKPARVDASVTGDWMRFGKPEEFGGQVTTHFKSGPDGWPAWLAEEARLHDPGAELAAVHAFLDEQDRAARAFELPTPAWVEAVRAASVPPGAPLSAVQPSGVSESAQSPTGTPEGALRADAFRGEGSGR